MQIRFTQIYAQVGKNFPFSHIFQRFLGEEISKIVRPSPKFVDLFGGDYNLIFYISAKWQLAVNEIVGPNVIKKHKEAEHTIFLPYTPIMQADKPLEMAIEHLLEGVCYVLNQYEIDISQLEPVHINGPCRFLRRCFRILSLTIFDHCPKARQKLTAAKGGNIDQKAVWQLNVNRL